MKERNFKTWKGCRVDWIGFVDLIFTLLAGQCFLATANALKLHQLR